MSNAPVRNHDVDRRGELLAELFLQDLGPEFLARPTFDFGYDLLMGFRNSRGGLNNVAVVVKATERPVQARYTVSRRDFERWANSNIPVLLLVVDVKNNRLFHTWPTPDIARDTGGSGTISIRLTEIDESMKETLRRQFVG
jgi:hypothetical protein